MPKFRIQISVDNEDRDHARIWGVPFFSPSVKLRRVLFIWGWIYVEAKLLKG